jgi:hypothetical protein
MNSGPAQSAIDFCALIYGSLVSSLLEMTEDSSDVNATLEKIGDRVGRRLAHDFARRPERVETPDAVVSVISRQWTGAIGNSQMTCQTIEKDKRYQLRFEKSVYTKQVTIPDSIADGAFRYESMLPGALRGIFQVFHYDVKVTALPPEPDATLVEVVIEAQIPVAVRKDDD